MILTYRGNQYDKDAALKQYLLSKIKRKLIKAELERDVERLKTVTIAE